MLMGGCAALPAMGGKTNKNCTKCATEDDGDEDCV